MRNNILSDISALVYDLWEQSNEFRWYKLYNECREENLNKFHIAAKHYINDARSVLDYIGSDISLKCGIECSPEKTNFLLVGIDENEGLNYYTELLELYNQKKSKEEIERWKTLTKEQIISKYKLVFDKKIKKLKPQLGIYYDFIETHQPYNTNYGWLSNLNMLDNQYKHNAFPEIKDISITETVNGIKNIRHRPIYKGLIFQIGGGLLLPSLYTRVKMIWDNYLIVDRTIALKNNNNEKTN